jgi:hypothetical protein
MIRADASTGDEEQSPESLSLSDALLTFLFGRREVEAAPYVAVPGDGWPAAMAAAMDDVCYRDCGFVRQPRLTS